MLCVCVCVCVCVCARARCVSSATLYTRVLSVRILCETRGSATELLAAGEWWPALRCSGVRRILCHIIGRGGSLEAGAAQKDWATSRERTKVATSCQECLRCLISCPARALNSCVSPGTWQRRLVNPRLLSKAAPNILHQPEGLATFHLRLSPVSEGVIQPVQVILACDLLLTPRALQPVAMSLKLCGKARNCQATSY